MGRPRKFDYDECLSLWKTGEWLQQELADHFGVSTHAVRCAIDPSVRAYAVEKQKRYRTPWIDGCGALVYGRYKHTNGRCVACARRVLATSVRETELRCTACREWKPDKAFPHNRATSSHRRGRHGCCRECLTAQRRAYREARKVPCSHGCGTMVLHEQREQGKPPECHPCAMKRIFGRAAA